MPVKSGELTRSTIRLLRKVQKFLIEEPRRFDMSEGVKPSGTIRTVLAQPPCGTACCIAGAGYVIDKKIRLNVSNIMFGEIEDMFKLKFKMSENQCNLLFYIKGPHNGIEPGFNGWNQFYTDMYLAAKTPLERACVGVARIEHFIATDGRE